MIRQIVAVDNKNGLAKNGYQPWSIPEDISRFKEKTTMYGGNVLMGSKTFDAINHLLVGRNNFIATRNADLIVPGAIMVHDVATFLDEFTDDLWVIGGAEMYTLTLDRTKELYITEIAADFACDRFYPSYKEAFELKTHSDPMVHDGVEFRYCMYQRK